MICVPARACDGRQHTDRTYHHGEVEDLPSRALCLAKVWVEMAGLGPQQAKGSGLQVVPDTRRLALCPSFVFLKSLDGETGQWIVKEADFLLHVMDRCKQSESSAQVSSTCHTPV